MLRWEWPVAGLLGATAGIIATASPPIAVAVVVALLAAYVACVHPRTYLFMLLASILLIPVSAGLQLTSGLPVIFVWRPLIGIGVLAALVRRGTGFSSSSAKIPLKTAMTVFLLGSALSLAQSVDFQASLFKLLSLLFEWAGIAFLTWELLRSQGDCRVLLNVLAGLVVVVCLLGLAEATTGFNINSVLNTGYTPEQLFFAPLSRGGLLRVRSTLAHPIELGGLLAFLLPIFTVRAIHPDPNWWRSLAHKVTAGLVAVTLALTLSLGPILAAGVGMLVLFALGRDRTGISWGVISMASVVALVSLGAGGDAINQLVFSRLDFSTGAGGNVASRVAIVLAALHEIPIRPWLGSGLATWFDVKPYAEFAGWTNTVGGAGNENFYAQTVVETGLIGLGAALLLIVATARQVWTRARSAVSTETRQLLLALLAAQLGYYVLNGTANVFDALQPTAVFWVCTALLLRWQSFETAAPSTQQMNQGPALAPSSTGG